MPTLVRHTRQLVRACPRIALELFWFGSGCNFSTIHDSLDATPAMTTALTANVWSIDQLLR